MAIGQGEFEAQVAPHRKTLLAYCYRMLGSWSDAEDAVQEALVRAWKGLDTLDGKGAFKAWLFQIATRTCLDLLAQRKRRHLPDEVHPAGSGDPRAPDPLHDWLEPAPLSALDLSPGPETVVERRQSVALAFLITLQALPATQRAALVLKDVLGFSAEETAAQLDSTVPAVNSLLQRARASVEEASPRWKPRAEEPKERELLGRYLRVWESSDVSGLVSLLREDATMTMPPMALWLEGLGAISQFLGTALFAPGVDAHRFKAEPIDAAGHPAIALSMRTAQGAPWEPNSLHLVEAQGDRLVHVVAWVDPVLTAKFLKSAH